MASGAAAAITSVMNLWVPRSIPLAQAITGFPRARCGASAVTASRKCCAGVAIRMMPAAAASAISLVTLTLAANDAPDSFGLTRVDAICAALSALRAYKTTSRPARAATSASAVPQAPAPITLTELKDAIRGSA
jgi:hypothetical protein